MDKQELIDGLSAIAQGGETDTAHKEADALLLQYIGDEQITAAHGSVSEAQ